MFLCRQRQKNLKNGAAGQSCGDRIPRSHNAVACVTGRCGAEEGSWITGLQRGAGRNLRREGAMQCTVAQNVRRYGARSAGLTAFLQKGPAENPKTLCRKQASSIQRGSTSRAAPRQIGQNGKCCALYIFRRRALIPSDFTTHGVCFFWIRAKKCPARTAMARRI